MTDPDLSTDLADYSVFRSDGQPVIPLPFYWGLIPFLWKRLTGWRDAYGRRAQFIGWRG